MSLNHRTLYASPLVSILDVACSAGCGNGKHEEHCPVATLAFVRSGAFVRRDRMGKHVADATRVVFFDPTEPYMVDHPVPGGDRCTSLAFAPNILREAVRGAKGDRWFEKSTMTGSAEIHLAHRGLLEAARDDDPVQVEEVSLRLLQLCTEKEDKLAKSGAALKRAQALAADAQVLIASRYAERVTLESLAATLEVSPFRLCRAFRQATGSSLHQHLTQLRLAAALEKLPQYKDRLIDLALDLGFSSHSHFTHAFKGYYGRAPSALA